MGKENILIGILKDIGKLILIILMIIGLVILIKGLIKDVGQYKEYKDFCEDRPSFCYCSYFKCEFNTRLTQTCSNGNCSEYILSEDTKELCELANSLNDKKTLFRVGC
jgi:hypothetical protein